MPRLTPNSTAMQRSETILLAARYVSMPTCEERGRLREELRKRLTMKRRIPGRDRLCEILYRTPGLGRGRANLIKAIEEWSVSK